MPLPENVLSPYPGFIRSNRVDRRYDDAEHYLDVQFRLLREDFVCPLREGIQFYLQRDVDLTAFDRNEVRIYSQSYIHPPYIDEKTGDVVHKLLVDPKVMKNINWETSKRFINGTLLCVSHNGFQDIWFGTVYNREEKSLSKGTLNVCFAKSEQDIDAISATNVPFVVAESSTYFEAYRHVLIGLQSFRENELPFERYLVECNPDIKPPSYLLQAPSHRMWDLSCLMSEGETGEGQLDILGSDWPTCGRLGLDESQYGALRLALSKELAVIQGPPGTGKTFLGYKIAEVLLKNSHAWNLRRTCQIHQAGNTTEDNTREFARVPDVKEAICKCNRSGPILVVCYTNHALDQFLEGISRFLPQGIVRVGGRSESEKMKQFLLRNVRDNTPLPPNIRYAKTEARDAVATCGREIANIAYASRSMSARVLKSSILSTVMLDRHLSSLFRTRRDVSQFNRDDILLIWLFEGLHWNSLQLQAGGTKSSRRNRDQTDVGLFGGNDDTNNRVNDDPLIQLNGLVDISNMEATERHIVQDTKDSTVYGSINEWLSVKDEATWLEPLIQTNDRCTNDRQVQNINNVWNLGHRQRWRLYRYWMDQLLNVFNGRRRVAVTNYRERLHKLEEVRSWEDRWLLSNAKVIGMTTTGAAKCQGILQLIQPKIVIIEEAAEVLEAHIVTSLSMGCQHLILIGDHHQLRPSAAVYKLAVRYNMEISLFERVVANGFEHAQLCVQHRMRPEIADTLMPFFYDNLQNDCSVFSYPSIKGMENNMFFIDHDEYESSDGENQSRKNIFESDFTVGLAKYLIEQEYEPDQITILTTYTAQMFHLRKALKVDGEEDNLLSKIKVTCVDNFQGEENDIIILSLVRSNEDGKIGFLKVKNRVCVALSRARQGFYCFANFTQLAEQCDFWNGIVDALKQKEMIGQSLNVVCQQHSNRTEIKLPGDFARLTPNGGCSSLCNYRMDCGHTCKVSCHAFSHNRIQCHEICGKKCLVGHECSQICSSCQPECKPCEILCEKMLPCGHICQDLCSRDPWTIPCNEKCNVQLECGHPCLKSCSQPHICRCHLPLAKDRSCGHSITVECPQDPEHVECSVEVTKRWPGCGHEILIACSVELHLLAELDIGCEVSVSKVRSCGHTVLVQCSKSAELVKCVHEVPKPWPECGHENMTACHMRAGHFLCLQPCDAFLGCGHKCKGTCGVCLNGRVHIPCKEKCGRPLLCGHACKSECFKACRPCKNVYSARCSHFQGNTKNRKPPSRKCGEASRVCKGPCNWKCKHLECSMLCSEPCSRSHCHESCDKQLASCGHPCMGLCGEECPKLCRICDPDFASKLGAQLGHAISDETAFIKIEGCGHTFDSKGLDSYINSKQGTVGIVLCPAAECNNPMRSPGAYGQDVKLRLQQIEEAKAMIRRCFSPQNLKSRYPTIFGTSQLLQKGSGPLSSDISEIVSGIFTTLQRAQPTDEDVCGFSNVLGLLHDAIQISNTHKIRPGPFTLNRSCVHICLNWKAILEKWCQYSHGSLVLPITAGISAPSLSEVSKNLQSYVEKRTKSLVAWLKENFKTVSAEMTQDCIQELCRVRVLGSLANLALAGFSMRKDLPVGLVNKIFDLSAKLFNAGILSAADMEAFDKLGDEVAAAMTSGTTWKLAPPILEPHVPFSFDATSWKICDSGHIYLVGRCEPLLKPSPGCPKCNSRRVYYASSSGGGHPKGQKKRGKKQ